MKTITSLRVMHRNRRIHRILKSNSVPRSSPLKAVYFAASTIILTSFTSLLSAATINVPAGGNIQNSINQARAGDTIALAAGTYTVTSPIEINKTLTILGKGRARTTVRLNRNTGSSTIFREQFKFNVFNVGANNVRIQAMHINAQAGPNRAFNCVLVRSPFRRVRVINCTLSNAVGSGVRGQMGWALHGARLRNNQFVNNARVQAFIFIRQNNSLMNVDRLVISGNVFRGSGRERDLISDNGNDNRSEASDHRGTLIANNRFLKGGKWHLGTVESKNYTFRNNMLFGPANNTQRFRHAIHLEQLVSDVRILDNTARNDTGIGQIMFLVNHDAAAGRQGPDDPFVPGPSNMLVADNVFIGNVPTIYGKEVSNNDFFRNDFSQAISSNGRKIRLARSVPGPGNTPKPSTGNRIPISGRNRNIGISSGQIQIN